jgi:DNA-binding transcriptional LysR family regulator
MNIALELGSNSGIKDAVKRGLGIAFLSRLVVADDVLAGEMHAVGVRGLRLNRSFYLVSHRGRPHSPAAHIFLRFVESHPIGRAVSKRP